MCVAVSAAAICMADGNTIVARLAAIDFVVRVRVRRDAPITSLAFILVEVPLPV